MNISNSTFPNEGLNSSLHEEVYRSRDYDFTDIIALIGNGYKKAPVSILNNFRLRALQCRSELDFHTVIS